MRAGLRAGKPIRDAAHRLGFDLEAHRSTMVDIPLMDWADVVVLMNPTHQLKLAMRFGNNRKGQMWVLLGHFANPQKDSVPDPAFISPQNPKFAEVVRMIVVASNALAVTCKSR